MFELDDNTINDVSELFKALSAPSRIKILFSLKEGRKSVLNISDDIDLSQSAVSHQLKILKDAKLIKSSRDGKMIYYEISDLHIHTIYDQAIEHVKE